jgi:hypothetical protein
VNSHSLLITPLSATVTRNENEHDTASIFVVSGSRDTDFSLLPDQRIEFDYGSLGGRRTFQGYVNSVTPQKRAVGNQIDSSQEIFCYGASMALKGNRPRFFTALTLTQMMARIVSDANLGLQRRVPQRHAGVAHPGSDLGDGLGDAVVAVGAAGSAHPLRPGRHTAHQLPGHRLPAASDEEPAERTHRR